MKYIKGFFAFWYDFIVGDAWEVAAGVVVVLLALYVAGHTVSGGLGSYATLILPVAIVALLAFSLWRVRNSA